MMTARLRLTPIDPEDAAMIEALFAIQSDPDTWEHLPAAVETDISQTAYLAEAHAASARDYGLGWWAVSLRESVGSLPAGKIIGLGGCRRTDSVRAGVESRLPADPCCLGLRIRYRTGCGSNPGSQQNAP